MFFARRWWRPARGGRLRSRVEVAGPAGSGDGRGGRGGCRRRCGLPELCGRAELRAKAHMDFGRCRRRRRLRTSFSFLFASLWSFSISTNACGVSRAPDENLALREPAAVTISSSPCWRRRFGTLDLRGATVSRRMCKMGVWSWVVDAGTAAPDGGGRRGGGLGLPRYDGSMRQSRCLAGVSVATWMETTWAEGSST